MSNCMSHTGRRFFAKQLLKYVDVDIYGNGCMTNHGDEWGAHWEPNEIAAQYKFYLAFENNNCDGYVTEKLERAYQVGAIPIADEPGDYAQFDATGSAIITFDEFDNSPKKIAQYINKLGQDDELYLSRLRYKVPQDLHYTSTIKDMSNAFLRTWAMNNSLSVWEPDARGAECGVCQLEHDTQKG